jgi:transaldolase / glucose-6-phosphate isomerase
VTSSLGIAELVDRIWSRDPTIWTGGDEAQWLGWLDEPARMLERVDDLLAFASEARPKRVCLLGMGGSSLAPEVMRRLFRVDDFTVLDTTHPSAVRRIETEGTLFVASSKSGSTIETRSQLDYFLDRGAQAVVVTDPGSPLEQLGLRVFHGEPTIGGRYSALSMFGMLPAALMGLDVRRLLERAEEMREACRLQEGNPGLALGVALGNGWREGRDKVLVDVDFGLWVEQLLAESTGKHGNGLVPVRLRGDGGDVQEPEVRLPDPYELGQEFFRWEFATAVAGAILEVNPFDQPDVQAAKDKTNEVLARGEDPPLEPEGDVEALLAEAKPGDYLAVQAFVDPARETDLAPIVDRLLNVRRIPLALGLGPRYLHSTGQLHKGGPNTGIFVQVVDDLGEELPIPGKDFGFRRLIAAQAAGDYEALKERGRRVARIRL